VNTVSPIGANPSAARLALREQAAAFESLFMGVLMRTMRQGVHENAKFHGGRGEAIFGGLMDNELADRMGGRGGLGIAEMVEKAIGSRLDLQM